MRNVKKNIANKINAFRWYKCRSRINGYVMQNVIGNITNTPFIGVNAIARISISDQVEDNIKNN